MESEVIREMNWATKSFLATRQIALRSGVSYVTKPFRFEVAHNATVEGRVEPSVHVSWSELRRSSDTDFARDQIRVQ
jgi:hypothetical protein